MIKKLDKLLIINFIPPFIVTFFVAVFVLMMQFLWLYIDDIIGKGVSMFVILELIFYLSVSLFPLGLPIAVLISSVMVMGNLAERFELTSMKSAGIPLLRVMAPLIVIGFVVSLFSFMSSNYFLPVANLKYKSKMYDIKKHKPSLSLEAGVFNDDFQGVYIYISDKDKEKNNLEDVLIYDHNKDNGRYAMTKAENGNIEMLENGRYMRLNLYDGEQVQENQEEGRARNAIQPFTRTKFKEYQKVFDLSEFDINFTEESLFKSHHSMLSLSQLEEAIDSIRDAAQARRDDLENYLLRYHGLYETTVDTITKKVKNNKPEKTDEQAMDKQSESEEDTRDEEDVGRSNTKSRKPLKQKDISIDSVKHLASLFAFDQEDLYNRAKTNARSVYNQTIATNESLRKWKLQNMKHVFEWHNRISMALVCLLFLFIGAPMGAIVRKGGFGYPILIAIFYFVAYIILRMIFENFAEQYIVSPAMGAWYPVIILSPVGVFLTRKAMNDTKLIDVDRYVVFIKRIFSKKRQKPLNDLE